MRLLTSHLARRIGRLVAPAPRGKRTRTLVAPAGYGHVLGDLVDSWRTEAFGIEPDPERAARASASCARVLCCAFEDARLGHGGWSAAVIELPDPPARADADSLDLHALRSCAMARRAIAALAPGGVLIAIGRPEAFSRSLAHTLEARLSPLHAFSAASGNSNVIVALGTVPRDPLQGRLQRPKAALADRAVPLDQAPPGLVTLPPAPAGEPLFAAASLTWEQAAAEAAQHGVWTDPAFASALRAGRPWDLRPLMPLSRGHLGQLIAAGAFDNVLLEGPDGRPILVKGRTDKVRRTSEDGPARTTREAFRTTIVTLDPATGEFLVLEAGAGAQDGDAPQ